ncbi:MAG: phosphoribosylamine--glycine ligase [Methanosarcinales archaeon Met12]|nr:MAG: phosphoribosylamine--glycine ligase [Methanosarcinales archaeon Met12]
MKLLIVGSGGREHAIAETLARSRRHPAMYAVMKNHNPGIARLCEGILIAEETDISKVTGYADKIKTDLAIIGPEAPLAAGIVDALEEIDVPAVGPKKTVARIESDKVWARQLMRKHGIKGCPVFRVFGDADDACEFIDGFEKGAVVKPAGLTGGKGVKVVGDQVDKDGAKEYVKGLLEKGQVVIEERLVGEEFTVQAFVDGKALASSPAVQDHKRAYEGDRGPNTGGMGSYSDAGDILPFMAEQDYVDGIKIMKQTVAALKKETGVEYKGILYGQFMLTADGLKVIEFNCRFGDPEAMNVLPLLNTDLVEIAYDILNGSLSDVEFMRKATVCKYAVPKGYPAKPIIGAKLSIEPIEDALLFYASVNEVDGEIYTTSSRSLAVVGIADTISEAEKKAENALSRIKGHIQCRHDIGKKFLIQKRIDHIKSLRGL